jgi:hypothetical protein
MLATLLALAVSAPPPPPPQPGKPGEGINGLIFQFNGKKVNDVEANTKVKEFKPVFEKELKELAAKLPGKPEVKLTHWYTIINGGAVHWSGGDKDTGAKLMEALKKLPYVKSVEFDQPVAPPGLPKT